MRLVVRFVWLFAAITLLHACARSEQPSRLAPGGPEQWQIDGQFIPISSTHYEQGEHGTVIYVITRAVPDAKAQIVDSLLAMKLALPFVKYAYDHRSSERAHLPAVRGSVPPAVAIGVDLTDTSGKLLQRIVVPAGEITWHLQHPDAPE